MLLLDTLVEQRIADAIAAGAFEDLPGAGKPLEFDDDRLVPEELRIAHRILKNAGFLPPEVIARREVASLRLLLHAATVDAETERRARARLALLEATLELKGRSLREAGAYRDRIVSRVMGDGA